MRDTLPIKKKKNVVIDKNLGKLGYERKNLRELFQDYPLFSLSYILSLRV